VKVTLARCGGFPETTTWIQPASAKPILLDIQNTIRTAGPAGIDKKLWTILAIPLGKAAALSIHPGFQRTSPGHSDFTSTQVEPIIMLDLMLNDESVLKNTRPKFNDHVQSPRQWRSGIVLGRYQLPKRQAGITNVVLCHHPPDWWADDDEVDRGHESPSAPSTLWPQAQPK